MENLKDGDYVLTSGCGWFIVKKFAIRIHTTDEGVAVDIYKEVSGPNETYAEPISSAYGLDSELLVEESSR